MRAMTLDVTSSRESLKLAAKREVSILHYHFLGYLQALENSKY